MNETILKIVAGISGQKPLVHNITNYVVMNNTANALLAIGASPVMAHAQEEVEDMVHYAGALVINMGTLSPEWVKAMIIAGEAAIEDGTPVIFDPVGVGATPYRNHVAKEIVTRCKPTIIRGNSSEIMALAGLHVQTKGVDAVSNADEAVQAARQLAKNTGAVVVISGKIDYVISEYKAYIVEGGSDMMPRVTGMGCTATALLGACAAVVREEEDYVAAALSSMVLMSVAAEIAEEKSGGPGSLQMNFLDALYCISLDPQSIVDKIQIHETTI